MLIYLFIPEIIPYQRNLIKTSYISNKWRCCSFPSTFTKCKQTNGKNKTQLLQFFNICIIIYAFILINIYYFQVYIAQIMKLDVIILCYGGRYLPSNYRGKFVYAPPLMTFPAMSCQWQIQIYLLHSSLSAHCRFYIVIPFNSLLSRTYGTK